MLMSSSLHLILPNFISDYNARVSSKRNQYFQQSVRETGKKNIFPSQEKGEIKKLRQTNLWELKFGKDNTYWVE